MHHVMTLELIHDLQTVRYTCPVCQRCLEDGPEGITLVFKGDPDALHSGGTLADVQQDVVQDAAAPGASARPLLH